MTCEKAATERLQGAKVILAVSGGVDSMVLLDLMAKKYSPGDIIIAHFDHGIRDNSGEDVQFVAKVAEEIYHIRYIIGKGELGLGTSEEAARAARYEFLRGVAAKNGGAKIYTAHHLDDLIETVAINLIRGTGWRGLSALDAPGIERPLLEGDLVYEPMDKLAIFEYAAKRRLRFREDQTNASEEYLRNRVREKFTEADWSYERKMEIWELWRQQRVRKAEIDRLVTGLLPEPGEAWQRGWFQDLESAVALELLRAGTLRAGISATRPQLEDFRQAILSYAPGKKFNLPGDRLVKLGKREFWLDEE